MVKLFKYLKSSYITILIIIGLLFGQAICDLTLPDYTSKIVNVGISNKGIENVAYKAIRQSEMEKMLLFVSEDDKEYILDNYDLLTTKNSNKYDEYTLLEKENIYELNTSNNEIITKISDILDTPIILVSTLEANSEQSKAIKAKLLTGMPEGTDVFEVIKHLDKDTISLILNSALETLEKMPESILKSQAILVVQNEYTTIGIDTGKIQSNYILFAGLKMLGIALISLVFTVLVGLLGSRLSAKLARVIRENVFKKVVAFSKKEMKEIGTSSLITRTTNDIQQVQMVMVMLLRIVFYAPIVAIGGIIKSLDTNTSMTWIIAIAVMAILTLILILFGLALPRFKKMQKLVDNLNLVSREILMGLPVIRAFNTEKYEEKRFDKANNELTSNSLFVNRIMSFMMPAMMLIMNVVTVVIILKGSYAIDEGTLQVGDMMAFIQYAMQILISFLMISMISIMYPRAAVSAKRIEEVLSKDSSIKDPLETKEFDESKKGVVEFKNVSFSYPDADEDVITNISFIAKPGHTTAFIGSTGSGKSTIVNLIPRFYDVTKGKILVDGVDIRKVKIHDLREKIGYVPQKGLLFSGTIESNIKYGNQNMSLDEIKEAAKIAQASDFIEKLKSGYESPISQGGTNISGGQKQRLSIARAIAKKPDIYIFDDSFSALDFKTDATLRKELKKITKESTVLIVAQRINTILNADQIIVLNEGEIVGTGTHKELLKNCQVYKEIALSQLSKEELENA